MVLEKGAGSRPLMLWYASASRCARHPRAVISVAAQDDGWENPIISSIGARCSFFFLEPAVMLRKTCQANKTKRLWLMTATASQKPTKELSWDIKVIWCVFYGLDGDLAPST